MNSFLKLDLIYLVKLSMKTHFSDNDYDDDWVNLSKSKYLFASRIMPNEIETNHIIYRRVFDTILFKYTVVNKDLPEPKRFTESNEQKKNKKPIKHFGIH